MVQTRAYLIPRPSQSSQDYFWCGCHWPHRVTHMADLEIVLLVFARLQISRSDALIHNLSVLLRLSFKRAALRFKMLYHL